MRYIRFRSIWTGVLVLVLATAAVIFAGWARTASASANTDIVALEVRSMPDRLRVSWNVEAAAVKHADSALLEVNDAGRVQRYPVPRSVLNAGTLDYIRHSDDVALSLSLLRHGQPVTEASVRTVGAPEQQRMRAAEPAAVVASARAAKRPSPARRGSRRR